MKSILIIIFLLFNGQAFARLTDGHLHSNIDSKENPKQIIINTDKGFHLNTEAPTGIFFDNQRALFQPSVKTEAKFIFDVPEKVKNAEVSLFVCDDKKTACEKHVLSIQLRQENKKSQLKTENATMMNETTTSAPAVITEKPRLIVFTAPWCPACIRMESETYNQNIFLNSTKNIIVEKYNIDLPENYAVSERYQIKAIPTLILLNEKGEQIGQWLDYTKATILSKEISEALKNKNNTLQSLEDKANQKDQKAIHDLAVRASKSFNCDEAKKWWALYEGTEDSNIRIATNVECANQIAQENEKKDSEYVTALESGILLSTSRYDQIRWTLSWMEKKKSLMQLTPDMRAKSIAIANELQSTINSPKAVQAFFKNTSIDQPIDFEKEELLALKRTAYLISDLKEDQKKTEEQLLKSLQTRKFTVEKPGQMLNATGYYNEINRKDIVEENFKKLIAKYPNTFVYYSKISNFYLKNKNFPEALKYADLALKNTEGNEPQLRFQKAKILKEMDRKPEATTEIEKIMANKDIQHPKYKKLSNQAAEMKEQIKTSK